MLWSTLVKSLVQTRVVNSQSRSIYPKGSIFRQPIRELDENGKPFVHPEQVRKINPQPKPVSDHKFVKLKKNFRKRRSFEESINESNDAISFIRDINRFMSSKSKSCMLVLEGERLIADAVEAGAVIKQIYFTHERYLKSSHKIDKILTDSSVKSQKVKESDMKLVSQVTTPPGIIAVCLKPTTDQVSSSRDSLDVMPVTVFADTIKDPGNMGGLIRSVSSAGADQVVTSLGCIDPWSPKVLRSAMGAHFRIPILTSFSSDALKQMLPSFENVFYAECEEKGSEYPVATQEYPYFEFDYFPSPSVKTALFVGGEAFGFSEETKEHLKEANAKKLVIPMSVGHESLNSYVAASIIIFEMRRHFRRSMMMDEKK